MKTVIDIDSLLGDPRVVRMNGVEYEIKEPSLREILEIERAFTEETDEIEGMKRAVRLLIPGLNPEDVPIRALAPLFKSLMMNQGGGEEKN